MRYTLTLGSIRDWNLKWRLFSLHKKLRTWRDDPTFQFRENTRAIDAWIESIRLECMGDIINAAYRYIDTLTLSQGFIREKSLGSLQTIINNAHATLKFGLSRCEEDLKLAQSKQKKRVRQYLQEMWLKYRPLLLAWAVYFPEERKRALKALEQAKEQVQKITGH